MSNTAGPPASTPHVQSCPASPAASQRLGASRRVAVQIADYGRALFAHADATRSSYRRVAQNLLALEGAFAASRRGSPALEQAATAGVSLDPDPSLIVYGFDRDQRDGDWKKHADKLTNALQGGPERLVMVGDPRGYRLTKPRSGRSGRETLHQNDARVRRAGGRARGNARNFVARPLNLAA
jgi:hypothetical protein